MSDKRLKVTTTSDPSGEWVSINEVAEFTGSSAPAATSGKFRGTITITTDAARQGTNDDGVWVQSGDVVTATYYDASLVAIDSDSVIAE
jgi:hypothetical protein